MADVVLVNVSVSAKSEDIFINFVVIISGETLKCDVALEGLVVVAAKIVAVAIDVMYVVSDVAFEGLFVVAAMIVGVAVPVVTIDDVFVVVAFFLVVGDPVVTCFTSVSVVISDIFVVRF